jgi:hypothetical protein
MTRAAKPKRILISAPTPDSPNPGTKPHPYLERSNTTRLLPPEHGNARKSLQSSRRRGKNHSEFTHQNTHHKHGFLTQKCHIPSQHAHFHTPTNFLREKIAFAPGNHLRRPVPHRSVIMRSQVPARVVRQRKLAKSTFQQVLREDQVESAEYNSLQNQYNVETGVEKSEEKV